MNFRLIDCGSMFVDESSLVAGINNASYRNTSPAARWVEIPVCAYLIESDAGYILFDTGCHERESIIPSGEDTPSPYVFTTEKLLPARLEALGINSLDIKTVVMPHLHCDHAGYLYLFGGAEVVVSDMEFMGAMKLYGLRGFGAGPYKMADFDAFLNTVTNWRLLDADETEYEAAPGVTAVHFGSGHAFGMIGMLLETKVSGNFLICSDALYRSDNLGPPIKPPGLIYDSIGYTKTAQFIARYAKKHEAKIIFGHDMQQFKSLQAEGGAWG